MNRTRASLLACAGLFAITATGARASVDDYSVDGNSSVQINLEVCTAENQLAVQGDAGTDLDFVITDPSGNQVHADQGIDDYLSIVLEKSGSGCDTFGLAVSNLGEESNTFQVVLEPIDAASTRVEKYIIRANETQTVDFKACGTSAQLLARGDGDTDLDFIIRNSDGAVVHEDAATTDQTTAILAGLLSDCETFEMEVSNLGDVYNALLVMVEPEGVVTAPFDAGSMPSTSLASGRTGVSTQAANSGAGSYSAEAHSSITVDLPVCSTSRMEVRGDGDTDLDFTVRNSSGSTVHSDFDLSDVTFATLEPSGGCETFEMEVSNLGNVYNVFSVALADIDDLGGVSGTGKYRVNATSSTKVALRVCSLTNVFARGDGDTDLDFDITDEGGNSIHSDYDLTDRTEFILDPGSGCADFQMAISNLGDVYNVLTVTFDDGPDTARIPPSVSAPPVALHIPATRPAIQTSQIVGSGAGEYRAPANGTVLIDLPVCETTFLSVEGDGDTDLDYQVFSASGDVVHSDYDLTDVTYTSISPSGGGCETFRMSVENLGGVYNVFTVGYSGGGSSSSDTASSTGATGTSISVPADNASTDGNNRNIAILNQTGESLTSIYWSNSATLAWGDDKLGRSSVLAAGQQWNVNAGDGSNACLFDFRAITESGREIEPSRINVCEVTSVAFE